MHFCVNYVCVSARSLFIYYNRSQLLSEWMNCKRLRVNFHPNSRVLFFIFVFCVIFLTAWSVIVCMPTRSFKLIFIVSNDNKERNNIFLNGINFESFDFQWWKQNKYILIISTKSCVVECNFMVCARSLALLKLSIWILYHFYGFIQKEMDDLINENFEEFHSLRVKLE